MNQNKHLRQSRDGYVFDENENSWHISKDITINFSQAVLDIDNKTLEGFKKHLLFMPKNILATILITCIVDSKSL